MQLSYNNVIKSQFAKNSERKVIATEYVAKNYIPEVEEEEEEIEEIVVQPKVDPEEILRKYDEIGKNIIEEAQRNKQKIELEAEITAQNAEKEAYEKGRLDPFFEGAAADCADCVFHPFSAAIVSSTLRVS